MVKIENGRRNPTFICQRTPQARSINCVGTRAHKAIAAWEPHLALDLIIVAEDPVHLRSCGLATSKSWTHLTATEPRTMTAMQRTSRGDLLALERPGHLHSAVRSPSHLDRLILS